MRLGHVITVFLLVCSWLDGSLCGQSVHVEIYINGRGPAGENDPDDDYVTWSPALCEARVTGLPTGYSGTCSVVLMNDPSVDQIVPASAPVSIPAQVENNPARFAGGRVRFDCEPATGWPADSTATKESIRLNLPANGDFVKFRIAGQFGRPSYNDKDARIIACVCDGTGTIVGAQTLMVRVRKNANRMHDFEIKRFLDAVAAYKGLVGGRSFDENAEIHRQSFDAGNEAHGGLNQPSFLPWHRAYLLQFERDLQTINGGAFRSVTIPYWNWDEATPRIWQEWFLGAPADSMVNIDDVEFHVDNPLDGWLTAGGNRIQRRTKAIFDVEQRPPRAPGLFVPALKHDPLANPSVLSRVSFGSSGTAPDLVSRLEGLVHNRAHSLNCGGGQISGGNSADDPAFYLLHCQIDREWAAWQNYRNRFGQGDSDYELSDGDEYVTGTSTLDYGTHLNDEIWPWDLSGGPDAGDPKKSRPVALGGEFQASPIRHLWPPIDTKPTNADLIDYEGRANPELGLGFCYDDVPFRRGPSIGANDLAALFQVSIGPTQTVGNLFDVTVQAVDDAGIVRTGFTGCVVLIQEGGTFGSPTPSNTGVHINGTATLADDCHYFVAADNGSFSFPVVAHSVERIPRFIAYAIDGGLTGESVAVDIDP